MLLSRESGDMFGTVREPDAVGFVANVAHHSFRLTNFETNWFMRVQNSERVIETVEKREEFQLRRLEGQISLELRLRIITQPSGNPDFLLKSGFQLT